MKKHLLLAAAAVFALAASVSLALDGPVTVRFIAQAPGTGGYNYCVTLGRFLQEALPAGSVVDIVPRGGSTANPTTIQMGKGDIALSATLPTAWAWEGILDYEKYGKHDKIRYISPGNGGVTVNYNFVIARRDYVERTGNDTVEKLLNSKERPRIAMKPQGSIIPPTFEQIFKAMGHDMNSYRESGHLIQVNAAQIGELMRDGRADVYMESTVTGHPAVTEVTLTNDCVFLPLPASIEDKMIDIGCFKCTMPAGSYKGQDKDYVTTGMGNNFIAHADCDPEIIYLLTKAMCERYDELVEENPQLKAWNPQENQDRTGMKVPLHPGAERYYRERGWLK